MVGILFWITKIDPFNLGNIKATRGVAVAFELTTRVGILPSGYG